MVDHTSVPRMKAIETDLQNRLTTAQQQNWLGDVERLRVTLTRLEDKRNQLPPAEPQDSSSELVPAMNGLSPFPQALQARQVSD